VMLDDSTLARPLFDHQAVDLDAAETVTYVLEQKFRYDYDAPVSSLRHKLVVVPPVRVEVDGISAQRRLRRDGRGNTVVRFQADRTDSTVVEFRLAALLQRVRDDGLPVLPAAALHRRDLLAPTVLTRPDERLHDWAADLTDADDTPLERAERMSAAVHAEMTYEYGITSVGTPAAQALAGGRGVCQDYAHILLALCHVAELPARYVSGHLLGQGGTHAWVEVVVPAGDHAVAVPLDPCNGRRAGSRYVTIATGRDYRDVAPTSGSYVGTSSSRLTASRRVGVLEAA
jgi:transglutaminase-like putative cysteine protease